jgi:predicted MFS family arabinose efflux permease
LLAPLDTADPSEGLFTVVCGVATFFVLPRTPGTAWWLTQEERTALVAALERDAPVAEQREKLTVAACVSALKAPQVWLMFCQFFASGAMLYAMAFFSPTIVGSLGYKGTKIQLMSVPPFVASAAFALICCWASDRLKMRGPFVILSALVSVIGYAMYRGSDDKHVRYGALFLQVMGAYTVAPLQSTWMREYLNKAKEGGGATPRDRARALAHRERGAARSRCGVSREPGHGSPARTGTHPTAQCACLGSIRRVALHRPAPRARR